MCGAWNKRDGHGNFSSKLDEINCIRFQLSIRPSDQVDPEASSERECSASLVLSTGTVVSFVHMRGESKS